MFYCKITEMRHGIPRNKALFSRHCLPELPLKWDAALQLLILQIESESHKKNIYFTEVDFTFKIDLNITVKIQTNLFGLAKNDEKIYFFQDKTHACSLSRYAVCGNTSEEPQSLKRSKNRIS